jgi:hypothetical protein
LSPNRKINNLLFYISFLHVLWIIFTTFLAGFCLLISSDSSEATNLIYKGFTRTIWHYSNLRLEGHVIEWVNVVEWNYGGLAELSLECKKKVENFILENIGHFLWIRNDAFYYFFIVNKGNIAYNWSERIVEKLNYLLWKVLPISDKNMSALSFLSALLYQGFRSICADSNCVNSCIFYVIFNQSNYLFIIADLSISE